MITTATTTEQDRALQVLYDHLVEQVFFAVIDGDAQVRRDIQHFGRSLCFVRGEFHFTLPDLFEFVSARCAHERGAGLVDYRRFRRFLYHAPTNATLRQRGGALEVADGHAEHALRVYRLVPRAVMTQGVVA
jgi:hypothetical protein